MAAANFERGGSAAVGGKAAVHFEADGMPVADREVSAVAVFEEPAVAALASNVFIALR
jgi:hypothetical protein